MLIQQVNVISLKALQCAKKKITTIVNQWVKPTELTSSIVKKKGNAYFLRNSMAVSLLALPQQRPNDKENNDSAYQSSTEPLCACPCETTSCQIIHD
jgi:hypothetical protein